MFKIDFLEEFKRDLSDKNVSPPSGMLILEDKFIFSDEYNHRIQICSRDNNSSNSTFFGAQGKESGNFFYPKGVASDSNGNIFIADCWNHRVQKFSPKYEHILSFGKIGEGPGEFNEPIALFIDKEDRVYVVDRCNHRIQIFDSNGVYKGKIGQRGSVLEEELSELYNTLKDLFSKPAFEFPNDISMDSNGNIYIVDANNHRIVKLNSKGVLITTIGKKGEGEGEFRFPYAIAIDKNDLLFVSDMNNERVQILTPQGKFLGEYKGPDNKKITCPTSLAVGDENLLYYSTGFDSSVNICKYETLKLDTFYSESSHSGISDKLFKFLYFSEKENYQAAHTELTHFFNSCGKADFLNVIKEGNYFFDLLLAPHTFQKYFGEKNSSALFTLMEEAIAHQKVEIRSLIDKRVLYVKQILERQIVNEQNIEAGIDNFDADIIRLEREERELFRAMRGELLYLKRVLDLRGDFIKSLLRESFASSCSSDSRSNSNLQSKMATRKQGRGDETVHLVRRGADDEVDVGAALTANWNKLLEKSAAHIHELLSYTLALLDERESYDARREELFKDETRNKEQNLADFRYFSTLFELVNEVVSIFVEIPHRQITSFVSILDKSPSPFKKEFLCALNDRSKDMALWEILTRLTVFTLMDVEPFYPAFEKKIKDFIGMLYESDDLKNMNLPSGTDGSSSSELLADIFRVLFIESTKKNIDKISKIFSHHNFDASCENIIRDALKAVNISLKEREKIVEEEAFTDVQLNGTLLRDERLRVALLRRLVMLRFSERLNLKLLVSHFMTLRSNLIISLKSSMFQMESAIFLNDLITDSISLISEIPGRVAYSKLEKKERLKLKKVDLCSKIILQNLLDLNSVIRNSGSLKESKGNFKLKSISQIKKDTLRGFEFKEPVDLSMDLEGNILIADTGSDRIFRASANGEILQKWGEPGHMEGQFFNLTGIAVNSVGEIFVSDGHNHRIQKFDKNGSFISFFGKNGSLNGEFNFPGRIAIDKDDSLFIVDQKNSRVQKFDSDGRFLFSFGKFGSSGSGEFQQPGGVAITKSGELIVGDYHGNKIQRFTLSGDYISNFEAPKGEKFSWVVGMCVDFQGRIFVPSFWHGKIWVYSDKYEFLGSVGAYLMSDSGFFGLSSLFPVGDKIWACDYFGGKINILELLF